MSTPYVGTQIVQITDTTDDAAKIKIKSAYVNHTSKAGIHAQMDVIPAVNSVIVGTEASELVNNTQRPERLILAVNYAPPDRKEGTVNNHRNDFFCADLGSGVVVCGTNNGLEFSYIKNDIKKFYRLTNTNHLGSQFRSLEVLPEHAILFSIPEERDRLIAKEILQPIEDFSSVVPSVPDITHVFQVDNFHNVKFVPSKADRLLLEEWKKKRQEIYFAFGGAAIEATSVKSSEKGMAHFFEAVAAETLFAAPLGTNIVAARSSSKLSGGLDVPIIATIRANPGETPPAYKNHIPKVGAPVYLTAESPYEMACYGSVSIYESPNNLTL